MAGLFDDLKSSWVEFKGMHGHRSRNLCSQFSDDFHGSNSTVQDGYDFRVEVVVDGIELVWDQNPAACVFVHMMGTARPGILQEWKFIPI